MATNKIVKECKTLLNLNGIKENTTIQEINHLNEWFDLLNMLENTTNKIENILNS